MAGRGHRQKEAEMIGDHLIDCELRGFPFWRLATCTVGDRAHTRHDLATHPIKVIKESQVSAALDGGNQVGCLIGRRATDMAIAKAKKTGLAVVSANQTWYSGMFSYYLEEITKAGFEGMVADSGGGAVHRMVDRKSAFPRIL